MTEPVRPTDALLVRLKSVLEGIGNLQARILLALFYYLILAFFALALRLLSDPLEIKPRHLAGWKKVTPPAGADLDRARRQS